MDALGVSPSAVSIALRRSDKLPASWYAALSMLAEERGIDCPLRLFAMKSSDQEVSRLSPQDNNATRPVQAAEGGDV